MMTNKKPKKSKLEPEKVLYKLTDKYPEYVKSHYVFLQGGIGGICCGSNHIMYRLDKYLGNPILNLDIYKLYNNLIKFTYNFDDIENKYIKYSFLKRYKKQLPVDYIQTSKGEVYKINNQIKNHRTCFYYKTFDLGKKMKVYEKNNKRYVKKGNLKIFLNKNIYYYLPNNEDNKKIFETTINEYNMI